ncbi:MAG: hypothetical protein LUQ57_04350 [Methylococcaceae bacterium]|nr:hypothetical protein [Methylococcaceae bacterium]
MKLRVLARSMLFVGAICVTSTAHALNDGLLNEGWFNTQIITTVKKDHSVNYAGSPPYHLNSTTINFDSGKENCYSVLRWGGAGSYLYGLYTFCNGPSGWEWDNFALLNELADGSLGTDYGSLYLPAAGASAYPWREWAVYQGTIVLKTRFKKSGNGIKTLSTLIQPKDGMIYYGNNPADIYGTARSGLKFKLVNSSKVPEGAKTCLDSAVGKIPPTATCPNRDNVTFINWKDLKLIP